MRISDLVSDRRPIAVAIGAGVVNVEYAPTQISADTLAQSQQLDSLQGMKKLDASIALLMGLLASWDLEDDPPPQAASETDEAYTARLADWEAEGPHIVPLTELRLRKLPINFLVLVLKAIFKDVSQGEATAPASLRNYRGRSGKKAH